jgi:hypothetical protein
MILPANTPKIVNFVDEVTGKLLASCHEDGKHAMAPDLTAKEKDALLEWILRGNLREMALSFGTEIVTIPCHVDHAHDGTMLRFKAIMEKLDA